MRTQCPNCNARFTVKEQNVGKRAKCPKCSQPFIIEEFVEAPVETPIEAPAQAPVEEKPEPEKAPTPAVPPRPVEEKPEPQKAPAPAVPQTPVEQEAESEKLSKTVYVYGWSAARVIAGIFCALGLALAMGKQAGSAAFLTFAVGNIFLIGSVVIELMLHYKMWSAIQDGDASVSAGKAVGLLFVPVFNIYWALYAVVGFAEDYNAFIRRHRVQAEKLSIALFLSYAAVLLFSAVAVTMPLICVLPFTALIPRAFIIYPVASWFLFFLALTAGISHFIVYIISAIKTCQAINALPD